MRRGEGVIDRPTQMICISDIYLFVISTYKFKRHSRGDVALGEMGKLDGELKSHWVENTLLELSQV